MGVMGANPPQFQIPNLLSGPRSLFTARNFTLIKLIKLVSKELNHFGPIVAFSQCGAPVE